MESMTERESDMEIIDRALAARDEGGAIVGRVFCAQCPRGTRARGERVLATVQDSSQGLVYDATLPSDVDMGPSGPEIVARQVATARDAGVDLPYRGAVGGCTVLLEDDDPEQDTPAAECPHHGREALTKDRIRAEVAWRSSKSPAVILINEGSV